MGMMAAAAAKVGYDARVPPRERDPKVSRAFGRAVRVERARRGLRRAAVAADAGITSGTLGRIERGERDPIMSVSVRLAAALGVKAWELVKAMEEDRER
jgi:transcriptional regulator with XRE-family HTH domain